MRNLIQRFEKAVLRKKVVRHRCATVLAASALAAAICAYGQINPEAATTSLASSSDWEESDSSGDAVREVTYEIEDGRIIGYALVPDSEVYTLSYTGEDYAVIVSYGGDALVPEDAELVVTEYDSDSEVWQNRYEETAALYGWEDEETEEIASDANAITFGTLHHGFRLFDIDVYADGEEVELAADATVYITLRAGDEPESCMVTSYTDGAADIGAVKEYESGSQIVSFGTEILDSYGISLTSVEDPYTILNFEGDDYTVTVTYDEEAGLPEGTELSVSEYGMDSETWHNRYNETALLYGWTEEDAYAFRLFDISLLADGEKIEPSADVKVVISFLNKSDMKDYTVTHYGEEKTETMEATSEFEEGTQSVSFDAAEFSDYSLSASANPTFTVQYYANLDVVISSDDSGDGYLEVIDTSNKGDGLGGNLPTNKTGNDKTYIKLKEKDGESSKYEIATETELTKVYNDKEFTYSVAPGLDYFNRLKSNDGYSLNEIWVLKGTDSGSTDSDDWDIYTYKEGTTSFTNTESEKTDSVIWIDDDSVIRLVYNIVDGEEILTANLYDYNITDGKLYTSPNRSTTTTDDTGTVYVYTVAQGINNADNYNKSGSKLAFGNNNTGTGLHNEGWDGNTLNMYNSGVDRGCTFGLVTSLDIINNKIEYSSGVDAPNLFSDGDANGKTPFPAQNITFIKEGDTYTIKSISGSDGVEVDSLNEFEHLTSYIDGKGGTFSIYTNSFWPLDGVTYDERDLMFGDVASYRNSYKNYITSSTKGLALPISDDSLAHNSYFGMEYAVQFTLSADYVGPLNYYFFGDDDMWVFLNDVLVCDIGGVHSSVGEYVDLWDYIEKGTSGTYTLSFYYTERGASGSSCYMRFTLPSVTDATLVQGTGNLKVEKEVSGTGADSRTGFSFSLGLTDSNNNTLKDTYGYRIYNSDNTESSTGTITNNGTFQLTNGQYIIVSYLPVGTICTVEETTTGYVTTYTVDSGSSVSGSTAEANITENDTVVIHFLNTREFTLPESGGSGVWMFASMGVALCGATGVVFYRRRGRV